MSKQKIKKLLANLLLLAISIGIAWIVSVKLIFPMIEKFLDSLVYSGNAWAITAILLVLLSSILGFLISLPDEKCNR